VPHPVEYSFSGFFHPRRRPPQTPVQRHRRSPAQQTPRFFNIHLQRPHSR
jgi:hypothetical protein